MTQGLGILGGILDEIAPSAMLPRNDGILNGILNGIASAFSKPRNDGILEFYTEF